jgi:hypothetical protein
MRFSGPAGVETIGLSVGQFTPVDGFVELPDELTPDDLAGLASSGFKAAPTKEDFDRADKVRAAQGAANAKAA